MVNGRRFANLFISTALLGMVSLPVFPAQRSFVSAYTGSDANPCSRQQPCRQFDAAVAQTDTNGEVVVLDSGGYGQVSITKGITLVAPSGVYAGITGFTGNAIDITTAGSDVVILRGLSVNGLGGFRAISFAGPALHVENCSLSRFAQTVLIASAGDARVYVKDTSIQYGAAGFHFQAPAVVSPIRVSMHNVQAIGTLVGIRAGENSVVTVTGGVAAGNDIGFATEASTSSMALEKCVVTFNDTGISAPNGTIHVSNTLVTGNTSGVAIGSGSIVSLGNNRVRGNINGETFTSTIPQQ